MRPAEVRLFAWVAAGVLAWVTACESADRPVSDAAPLEEAPTTVAAPTPAQTLPSSEAAPVALVDSSIPPAVAGEDGWMYSQSVETDIDGDGAAERVVLTAQVELYRGRPAWDDGQRWQVYVEEPDGRRTYLYARFVQLGTVTLRVGLPEGEKGPSIVLLEHLPDRLSVHEVVYRGPGDAGAVERFQRSLDPTGEVASPALP